eukprot:424796-Ditylum_brightwellii.AAC.1
MPFRCQGLSWFGPYMDQNLWGHMDSWYNVGITSLPLDQYLKFRRQLLLHILKAEENIQPHLSSKEKFDSFVEAIA